MWLKIENSVYAFAINCWLKWWSLAMLTVTSINAGCHISPGAGLLALDTPLFFASHLSCQHLSQDTMDVLRQRLLGLSKGSPPKVRPLECIETQWARCTRGTRTLTLLQLPSPPRSDRSRSVMTFCTELRCVLGPAHGPSPKKQDNGEGRLAF